MNTDTTSDIVREAMGCQASVEDLQEIVCRLADALNDMAHELNELKRDKENQ